MNIIEGRRIAPLPDGTYHLSVIEIPIGPDSLKILQTAVGGFIELLPLSDEFPNAEFYVNEEGALENLPVNIIVSRILGYEVYGPAVSVPRGSFDGD